MSYDASLSAGYAETDPFGYTLTDRISKKRLLYQYPRDVIVPLCLRGRGKEEKRKTFFAFFLTVRVLHALHGTKNPFLINSLAHTLSHHQSPLVSLTCWYRLFSLGLNASSKPLGQHAAPLYASRQLMDRPVSLDVAMEIGLPFSIAPLPSHRGAWVIW